jgi:hypothetical protein
MADDLADAEPALVNALRRTSEPLFETGGTSGGAPVEPTAEMLERLRALGYAH